MSRSFKIPEWYKSGLVSELKTNRSVADPRKKDLSPSKVKAGNITIKISRHLGFCYGVQNAIEIAFKAIEENPGKRIFLLSEMIHNPAVNEDLKKRGISFLMSTDGKRLMDFNGLKTDDIVIVPAFGTTVELFSELEERGIQPARYNATCPFVEKVWTRARELGKRGYTIVIHGKHLHEETKATFSHARTNSPAIVVRDLHEAQQLSKFILEEYTSNTFHEVFAEKCSQSFDPVLHLQRIGVVNQTTMLAEETHAISKFLRSVMKQKYGEDNLSRHFAETRDTLCYATSENQSSVRALVESGGDVAVVIGGYNSSNTYHLAKLCSEKILTYYIKSADDIVSESEIVHLDLESREPIVTRDWMANFGSHVTILVTAGASCPDSLVDKVILKLCEIFKVSINVDEYLSVG